MYDSISVKLAEERNELSITETKIEHQQARQITLAEEIALGRKVHGKLDNFESEYERLEREISPDLVRLGLDFKTVFSLWVNKETLTEELDRLTSDKAAVDSG